MTTATPPKPMTMKAIETRYAGHRFRSRLEARWAVVLDRLGIKWLYEHEGFETEHGLYLPDFWLPDYNTFLEVKAGQPTSLETSKLQSLIEAKQAFGAFGLPLNEEIKQSFGRLTDLASTAPLICLRWHPYCYAFPGREDALRPPSWPSDITIPPFLIGSTKFAINNPLTCPECGTNNIHCFNEKTRADLRTNLPSFTRFLSSMYSENCHHLWVL